MKYGTLYAWLNQDRKRSTWVRMKKAVDVADKVKWLKRQWVGHVDRGMDDSSTKEVLECYPKGCNRVQGCGGL